MSITTLTRPETIRATLEQFARIEHIRVGVYPVRPGASFPECPYCDTGRALIQWSWDTPPSHTVGGSDESCVDCRHKVLEHAETEQGRDILAEYPITAGPTAHAA